MDDPISRITSSVTSDLDNKIVLGKSNILRGHTKWVNTICVKDSLIISGSSDNTIRIWDRYDTSNNTSSNKYDYKCVQVLTGHTGHVISICVKDNLIISGSSDYTIRIWDNDDTSTSTNISTNKYDYKCVQILEGHTGYINTICVKDNLIISGSDDETIRIWDATNTNSDTSTNKYDYKYVQVLTGHNNSVNTICVKDNLIISGSDSEEICIWDVTNTSINISTNKYDYKCVQILTGHSNWVNTICVKDNLIISGSYDGTIRIWDRDDTSINKYDCKYDYKCVKVLKGHTNWIDTICVKDNLIISGSSDKTIRIWDRYDTSSNTSSNKYDFKCVQILKGHTNWVNTICVKDNLIISGSCDETIRITPINLFPNESHIFKILINNYHLVSYLQKEILDYFRSN